MVRRRPRTDPNRRAPLNRTWCLIGLTTIFALSECIGSGAAPSSPSLIPYTPSPAATPAVPPTSLPTVAPHCPAATTGTLLLKNEDDGYCLLYPEGHIVVIPYAGEVCLVPGEPYMSCHTASLFINAEGANGRTADQVAEALIAEYGPSLERSSLTIADEEAVMLEPFYGQATSRRVLIVHADRLYTLEFIGPWGENGNPALERSERFYTQIIGSFVFVPAPSWLPSPTSVTQQLFVPGDVQGTKFIAEASGVYKFEIISGSYSVCPSSAAYPACGKWYSEILVYVNRDIAWTAQPNRWTAETNSAGSFAPSDPDFLIGNSIYMDTAEEAESGSIGGRATISLEEGDFVWLLPADGRDAYYDNVGGMTLSISIIAPLP